MTVNTTAKYLLEEITFDHENAHLAYTIGSGAASKKNKAFLFKGEEELDLDALDDESLEFLKAMKTEQGKKLSASSFAYVPDAEKPSTWKLRIDDATHVRSAVAALGKGMMGNKVQIPSKDLAAVKRKVRSAYKKFYPDNDVPTVLKSLDGEESGLMLGSDDNANLGINKEENNMTDKTFTQEDLNKAAEDKALELLKAKEKELEAELLKKFEKQQEEKELHKSTTTILKGMDFIKEELIEDVVKSVILSENDSIMKAFEAAKETIELAKAAEATAKEDLVKFKDEFGTPEAIQGDAKEANDLTFQEKKARAVEIAKSQQTK